MALSLDAATQVFTILQADLTFISGSLYELDTDAFRREAMLLCASEDYIWMPNPYNHNSEVTIFGATYARTLEFTNGYSITFENLTYSVRLAGSNNNIADVENGIMNASGNVTVIAQNAAGLIVNAGQALGQGDLDNIADAVWIEPIGDHDGVSGSAAEWVKKKLLSVSGFLGLS